MSYKTELYLNHPALSLQFVINATNIAHVSVIFHWDIAKFNKCLVQSSLQGQNFMCETVLCA